MILFLAILPTAMAGYGDVSADGYPSWGERGVHIWTNAVRVEPKAFADEYPCDYEGEFLEDEQIPKAPLYYDFNLNDAARFHSQDMYDTGTFSHSSSDGTSFGERVSRFYVESGYIGENIAMGYADAYAAVVHGWMCSAGHRANIMYGDWNELGTGVITNYYTQDFAAGTIETTSPIAMGHHTPELPTSDLTFMADWYGMAPTTLEVMIDGEPTAMELTFGSAVQGIYSIDTTIPDGDCHEYWFRWTIDEETGGFPEDGSYLFGAGCDEPLMWVEGHLEPEEQEDVPEFGEGDDDTETDFDKDLWSDDEDMSGDGDIDVVGCGCTSGPQGGMGWAWLALFGLVLRRRND